MLTPMHRTLLFAAAAVTLCGLISAAPATEGGDSKKDLETKIYKLLADTMDLGAETYNGGNREGCYQLYLGTLRALNLSLEHRPNLQKVIADKIGKAKGQKSVVDRAFTLREALDEVHAAIGKDLGYGKVVTPKTLWERLGGETAVRAVVKDFVASAAGDPKVNIDRNGKYKLTPEAVKDLEQKLVEMVSAASGGPLKYTGKDMKTVHKGMGITDDEFNALAGHLVKTLDKFKVPAAEKKELLGAIAATRGDIVEPKKKETDTKKTETKKTDSDTKKTETKKDTDTKKTETKSTETKGTETKKSPDTKKIETDFKKTESDKANPGGKQSRVEPLGNGGILTASNARMEFRLAPVAILGADRVSISRRA